MVFIELLLAGLKVFSSARQEFDAHTGHCRLGTPLFDFAALFNLGLLPRSWFRSSSTNTSCFLAITSALTPASFP
jgi:hypothetical protein